MSTAPKCVEIQPYNMKHYSHRWAIDRDVVVCGDGSAEASVSTLLSYFDDIWSLNTNRAFHANSKKRRCGRPLPPLPSDGQGSATQSGANPRGCADYLNHKDCISVIGSFNWDMRSAYLDTEMMLLVDCPALNAALREETDAMLRQGKLLSRRMAQQWRARRTQRQSSPPLKRPCRPCCASLFSPFRYLL